MVEKPDRRLSRRETLKRGAVLGGATLWATPVVQSLTVQPAFAQATPVPPGVEGPSYIAMNVTCSGLQWVLKLQCNGTCEFEGDPGNFPTCGEGDPPLFTPVGEKADGDTLGFTFTEPDADGCVTVVVPDRCIVNEAAIKDSQSCCPGDTGIGTLVFCRCR